MIKKLKPLWVCNGFEYVGQSIDQLNAILANPVFELKSRPCFRCVDNSYYLDDNTYPGIVLDVGDWIICEDGYIDVLSPQARIQFYELID